MKKTFLILSIILLFCSGCSLKSLNFLNTKNHDYDSVTENFEDDKPVNAGATFLVDDKEIFLTWEELQKPENEELYYYKTSEITDMQIGDYAFYDCSSLTSIIIPDSVTTIDEEAFEWCANLTLINVDANNPKYVSIDGVLFEKNNNIPTKLVQYPAGKEDTSYIIPDSVTTIGEDAFLACRNLTSITIPDSVTSIGDFVFDFCYGLTSITIPNSVTSIGYCAFMGCENLTSITIPNSVTSIGSGAFSGCENLTSITIPNSVTTIGDAAFHTGNNLTLINVDINNPNYVSIDNVLFEKTNNVPTKIVRYPAEKEDTTYTIPDSVTTIGEWAFDSCTNLTSITIPNSVTTIGDFAFMGCIYLTSITISNSVTTIGQQAFWDCFDLISITIPDSVTEIGNAAFDDIPHIYYNGPATYDEYDTYWGALAMN